MIISIFWRFFCLKFFIFRETVRVINGYMKKNNLGFELQSRVRRYLEYTIKNEKNNNEQMDGILNKLTKSLKSELILQSYQKYIQNSKFFKNFSSKTQEKIVLSLKVLKLSPEESIHYVLLNKIFPSKCFFLKRNKKMMILLFIF